MNVLTWTYRLGLVAGLGLWTLGGSSGMAAPTLDPAPEAPSVTAPATPAPQQGQRGGQRRGGLGRGGQRGGQGSGQGGGFGSGQGQGQGRGQGQGFGQQGGRGGRNDATFQADQKVFHQLLAQHEKIQRQVKNLNNGVETLTESDDPQVARLIQQHVVQMYKRVEQVQPIHMRDPLFAALFRNAGEIKMAYEATPKGVRVVETSDNPFVAKLIQAHAQVVSLFVANGMREARKNHEVPQAN